MKFNFSVDDREVRGMLRHLKTVIPRLTVQSLNKAARASSVASAKKVASREDTLLRPVRRRYFVRKANAQRPVARISVNTNPIPAGKAGKVRQTRRGAAVRGHSWPGGWVATIRKDRTAFRREGAPRGPVDALNIPIRQTVLDETPRAIQVRGGEVFVKEFTRLADRAFGRLP